MLGRVQSSNHTTVAPKDQSEQRASEITNLKSVLHNDFQVVESRLRASKTHYEDLNARFVAADKEHTRFSHVLTAKLSDETKTSSLMTAKLLAEADGQEFYARSLRERVTRIEQQRINDNPPMLQLTASPQVTQQRQSIGAFELDAGHAATQMSTGSDVSEDTIYAEAEGLQPTISAKNEQQSPEVYVLQVDEKQVHHTKSVEEAKWQPHAIAQLTPLDIPSSNNETFTWEELIRHLGGNQYSPGLYFSHNEPPSRLLQGRTYWVLESKYEPFAPTYPGQHGAKLTAFFNDSPTPQGDHLDEEDYANVPLFVCLKEGEGYTYLGQYSQNRYSDKLSHSELFQHVPTRVLKYWAQQLAEPHRPAWITDQLISHFWPPPPYTGPIPTDSAITSPASGVTESRDPERVLEKRVARALERYAVELRDWKKDAQMRATLLTENALMETWNNSDMDEEKGLRLWWEYLQCVGFDEKFYEKLVLLKRAPQQQPARKAETATVAAIADISTYSGEVAGMHTQRHDSFASPALISASTVKPKEPTLTRSNRPAHIAISEAFPQADLRAAREMQDKATKASDRKRGRSDKQQALPPHAPSVKW